MSDKRGEEVEILRDEEGWMVTSGARRVKHFVTTDDPFGAVGRACEWGGEFAAERGSEAWLRHSSGRRTRITLANSSVLWKRDN